MKQKIKSKEELNEIKNNIQLEFKQMGNLNDAGQMVQIRIGMATCGIASGAKEIMHYLKEETEHQAIDAKVMQTGCLGYCYAEPTVEVTLPGEEPVVFGYVNKKRAQEIIDVYINMGKLVYPVIPLNFRTIDE
ncbi:MAG: (2Fe-2S) ferredoxin domain-containing protein [Mariniphaga sp.]|nr:(2Fe-2S) ferredoxin domain-containing protein [Mariniphaga sp.]